MTRDIEKIKDRIAGCLWGHAGFPSGEVESGRLDR